MSYSQKLRSAVLIVLGAVSISAYAAEESIKRVAVPPGPLTSALKTLAEQSGVEFLYSTDQLRGLATQGVQGEYTAEKAILKLLEGTNLKLTRHQSGALVIAVPETAAADPSSTRHTLRLAQSDSPSPLQGAGRSEVTTNEDGIEAQSQKRTELEEIVVVVGSRLRRPADGPAPVTTFERSMIDASGVTNVADVLKYLPQQSFSVGETFSLGGQRIIQLRGLAPGTTLVLINGRRTVPGAVSINSAAFDLNTIPLSAVERIEVLADSASAVYGADAIGGVVNVVLKSNIERPVLDVYYGSAEGGADERRVSLATGGRSDRGEASITFDYFKRNPLFGSERDVTANADFRRFGGIDRRVLTSNPGNICAVSGNLPGLTTPCAAVPAGSTGVGLSPASFAATAGQSNFTSLRRQNSIVPESERYSAAANGTYDITPDLTLFAELMYADRSDSRQNNSPVITNGMVPATNPFNPFGVTVRATYLITGIAPSLTKGEEKAYREVVGLRGNVDGWDWEISAVGAHSEGTTWTENNVSAARVTAALAATAPSQALNVFQDGPGGDVNMLTSLIADKSATYSPKTSKAFQLGGFARGEIFNLPAGAVQLVAGGEWRHEGMSATVVSGASVLTISGDTATRDSWSLYAESRAPIFDGRAGTLDVTLAGRFDHYSDFGGTFNAEYGAEWRPVPTFLLRGSYGESYRAPGLFQLFTPVFATANIPFGPDPRRGGEAIIATWINGGNPKLQPETSTASSIGAVWMPDVTWRPRLSTSFWRIKQDQRIVNAVSAVTLIANERFFPERFVRAAPTTADVTAGRPGRIQSIDTTLLNQGSIDTSGLDMDVSASFATRFGTFSPTLTATWVANYKAADFPTTPIVQRVAVANTGGTIPEWKAVGSLGWTHDGYSITGFVRYTSAYDDTSASTNVHNGLRVSDYTAFDLQASVDLEEVLGGKTASVRGTSLRIGAINLFDNASPFSDVTGAGYDTSQADLRQRFIYVTLSKRF